MITKAQEKHLDDLWRKAIKCIYPKCILDTKKQSYHAHHIHTRSKKSTRWHILNGVGMSPEEHTHTAEMHKKVKEWFINKYSQEAWDELKLLSNTPAYNLDYEEIKTNLEKFIR